MAVKDAAFKLTNRPSDPKAFEEWVETNFKQLESSLDLLSTGHLPKTYVAPFRPYDGMKRYADGTQWDPGAGEGEYIYYAAAWHKCG